jgi:hypothetical protein
MARLIDTHARRFDVTDTRVVLVDASPLGFADRLTLTPTRLEARDGEHVYGMAAGSVKVIWNHRVQPGPESATTLSGTTRIDARPGRLTAPRRYFAATRR